MSDLESSTSKEIEIDADGEGGEAFLKKTPSPESDPEPEVSRKMKDRKVKAKKKNGVKVNGSRNRHRSLSQSKSDAHFRSRSRSSSYPRSRSGQKRPRSRKEYSRSRSRSPRPKRRYSKHSRSRSRGGREYEPERQYDEGTSHRSDYNSYPVTTKKSRITGDRENPIPNRCIGVFGLSLYTHERGLREVFGRYGPIDEVQIVYDRQTGRSRGFAFIYFRSTDDAYEAKERCDGMEIDGRKIRVDFSITERPHSPTPGMYLGRSWESNSSYARYSSGRRTSTFQRCASPNNYGYRRPCSPSRKCY